MVFQLTNNDDEGSFLHRCKAGGKLSVLLLIFGLYSYTNDLVTDIIVSIEDYNRVKLLGFFELFLVVFTLLHENLRSAISLHDTEEEIIRFKAGKAEPTEEDWKQHSELRYGKGKLRRLVNALWPFKIKFEKKRILTNLKALLYNIFSLILLRPIIDRLMTLFHKPAKHRFIYRRKAEQNSLKQGYLILEQLPELLIQFYGFQKLFVSGSVSIKNNLFCNLVLPNHNGSDPIYYDCNIGFRIYSMAFPFIGIPLGIVSLEKSFRKLDSFSAKLSSTLEYMLVFIYVLLVPARLFLISSLMRVGVFPIVGVLISRTAFNCILNIFFMGGKEFLTKEGSIISKLGNFWAILMFSFRDCFIISLRQLKAYLIPASQVSIDSTRSINTIFAFSVWFVLEGFIGAKILQAHYPYQESAFKFTGWFCLLVLIIAIALLMKVSMSLNYKKVSIMTFYKDWDFLKIMLFGIPFTLLLLTAVYVSYNKSHGSTFPIIVIVFISVAVCVILCFFEGRRKQRTTVGYRGLVSADANYLLESGVQVETSQ